VKIAHVWPRVFLPHTQSSTPAAGRALSGRQFAVSQPPRARVRRGELQRHRPSLFQRPLDVPPPIRPHAYPACWATLPHDSVVAVSVSIACDRVADGCCCACTRPGLRWHNCLCPAGGLLDRPPPPPDGRLGLEKPVKAGCHSRCCRTL
jgi:hypothetical protein